jgi:small-conductance mechanosensitive channel
MGLENADSVQKNIKEERNGATFFRLLEAGSVSAATMVATRATIEIVEKSISEGTVYRLGFAAVLGAATVICDRMAREYSADARARDVVLTQALLAAPPPAPQPPGPEKPLP